MIVKLETDSRVGWTALDKVKDWRYQLPYLRILKRQQVRVTFINKLHFSRTKDLNKIYIFKANIYILTTTQKYIFLSKLFNELWALSDLPIHKSGPMGIWVCIPTSLPSYLFPFTLLRFLFLNHTTKSIVMVALCNRADHYIFAL